VFKIFKTINKKKTISILIIGILAILAISILAGVGTVHAVSIDSSQTIKDGIENTVSGGTLTLSSGTWKGSIHKNANNLIDKNLTIKGQGSDKTIIDLENKTNAFSICSYATVTIQDLTIKNSAGSAIENYGTMNVIRCTFSGNGGFETFGGAIHNAGTTYITNSIFNNNKALYSSRTYMDSFGDPSNTNVLGGYGGAIFNAKSGTTNLQGNSFNNNFAGPLMGGTFGIDFGKDTYNDGGKLNWLSNSTNGNNLNSGGTYNFGTNSNSNAINTPTTKKPDLKITKITKKGNYRFVFVKNIGKASAGKNTLGVYIGKTLIKTVSVKSIGVGKTLKVKVVIPKKYMVKKYKNMFKTFKVDIRNVVKESNEKNNSFKAK